MSPTLGKFGIGTVCAALAGALSVWIVASLLISSAYATSNYSYRKNEYAIVHGGLAPNKRFSVAAHGEGDDGYDNFHLHLMAEPKHKKLGRLDGIGPELLDTGPDAYRAEWSADSRHVVVYYRADRHELVMRLHRIKNWRAHRIAGPLLLDTVVNGVREKNLFDDGTSRYGSTELTWLSPTRFLLKEERVFPNGTPELTRILGKFSHSEPFVDGEDQKLAHLVYFSAEAICELVPGKPWLIDRRGAREFVETVRYPNAQPHIEVGKAWISCYAFKPSQLVARAEYDRTIIGGHARPHDWERAVNRLRGHSADNDV